MKKIISIFAIIGSPFNAAVAEKTLPNIVIIYADDLGYGDLTCYNKDSKIPTKHLDKLAEQGMRFTDGHSSSGICTPSRYALLTGRYHWRDFHGIVSSFGKSVFKPERLTLPEMLKEKGYNTAAIGKWHLGWDWNSIRISKGNKPRDFDWSKPIKDGPTAHGFDYYFGDTVINFPPYAWIENDKVTKIPKIKMNKSLFKKVKEGGWEFRAGPMIDGWDPYENIPLTTKKGVEYINEKAKLDEPYFLYFAYPSPHAPIIPNDEFDNTSKAGPYGDFVVETDNSIGQLLKAIEDSEEADNTVIIFSADNGPEKYAYERDKKYDHWSSYPLRGLKRDVYEGGHRVPFIISYPGVTKPNSVSDSLVGQIDIMGTIAEIVDYKMPETNAAEDSRSMLGTLKNASTETRQNLVHNTFRTSFAVRQGDWLLIKGKNAHHTKVDKSWYEKRNFSKEDQISGGVLLYNLKDDIAQKNNLAPNHPEKVKELTKLLKSIQDERGKAVR